MLRKLSLVAVAAASLGAAALAPTAASAHGWHHVLQMVEQDFRHPASAIS